MQITNSQAAFLVSGSIFNNIAMTAFLRIYTKAMNGFKALGNRGENEGAPPPAAPPAESSKTFSQDDVNRIIANERRALEGKFEGYDDLKKFKTEHEKQLSAAEQKRLEESGKYEEAKKTYETQIAEREAVIQKKDATLRDMQIGFSIQNEIASQNAYPDAIDLIKNSAVVQDDGSIKIKGKDANGIDTLLDVKTGVEQFLKAKPYLVKAGAGGGAGSGTGAGQGDTGSGGGQDLAVLNSQLSAAMAAGDRKTSGEVAAKIKQLQLSRGITSNI